MPATIFLHIGANKTGSSAIQYFFKMNRQVLIKKGVLYPVAGCVGNAHYGLSKLLGFVYGTPKPVDLMSKQLVELAEAFRDEVGASSAKSVVISSESFVMEKSVEAVQRFFSGYDVKVVVYVRRHDKWWPSAYNQAVRMVADPPWGRNFDSYLRFHKNKAVYQSKCNLRHLVERWAMVFGKENMIVRPYETQQNQPGLVSDFMCAIGRPDLGVDLAPENQRVNDSVDMNTLFLIDAFQRAKVGPDIRRRLIEYVMANRKAPEGAGAIDSKVLLELVEENMDDYEYIAREYLGRPDGRLFYDPLPNPDIPCGKLKKPRIEDVVESVVAAVMGVLGEAAPDGADSKMTRVKP